MQKIANFPIFRQKSFSARHRSFGQRIWATLLVWGILGWPTSTIAQILPSTPSAPVTQPGQPANTRPTGTLPGQQPGLPGQQQPGRTGSTTLPNRPGVGNQPGQQQQPGRGQQQQSTTTQPGRGQQTNTQNNGRITDPTTSTEGTEADIDRQQGETEEERTKRELNDNETLESDIERERRLERERLRRKIFGYELFNDPNLKAVFAPNTNVATPRNYTIGPGDQLNIRLFGYSEAEYSQSVSPEGNVYFGQGTGIGPVYVAGLSIETAKRRITDRLAKKFVGLKAGSYGPQNTYLEVSLGGQIRSIKVSVLGEAIKPGAYTIPSLSTAFNAIYAAGGPNELGSFRNVQLIRNGRVLTTLDLYDYLLTGVQRNDYRLQDNDVIRIPTYQKRVEVTGTVRRNNIFELLPGETLERLIGYAGGFAANAYKRIVKVTRLTDRELRVVDVVADQFKTFEMQDGDVVTIAPVLERFENQVTITGAVFRPGQYSLDQSKTLKELIQTAEGLKGDAFTGRVTIVRTREDMALENISVNLANILNGVEPDIPLQREDQVVVPSRAELVEYSNIIVTGEVNYPAENYQYVLNMTLEDLLLKAGGLKESAATSQIEVIRRKRDVDPGSVSAQIAEVYRFNVNRDLSIGADDSKFLMQPFDQVVVRRSPNYRVQTFARVEGEVISPGQYAIQTKDQKISDLIKLSGGLTPQAYIEGATLLRRVQLSPDELTRRKRAVEEQADEAVRSVVTADEIGAETEESVGINLKKILERPGSAEDMLLQEGDLLRIPKRLETVRIQGEVQLPSSVKYRPGQTFQDYVAQGGGFGTYAQRRKAFVVYANGSVDRTRKFMFFNIYPRVEPGSEIVVPRRSNTTPLTPQQVLTTATTITSSLITLIVTVLALRNLGGQR